MLNCLSCWLRVGFSHLMEDLFDFKIHVHYNLSYNGVLKHTEDESCTPETCLLNLKLYALLLK